MCNPFFLGFPMIIGRLLKSPDLPPRRPQCTGQFLKMMVWFWLRPVAYELYSYLHWRFLCQKARIFLTAHWKAIPIDGFRQTIAIFNYFFYHKGHEEGVVFYFRKLILRVLRTLRCEFCLVLVRPD